MSGGATRIATIAALALGPSLRAQDRFAPRPDAPDLDAAIQIDRWLENTAVKLDDGWAWPAVPDDWSGRSVPKESLDSSLYSGSAGIVLFGIRLAAATAHTGPDGSATSGSPFVELPDRAATHLIATLPTTVEGEGCGLYSGIAGVGFALREWTSATHHVDGDRAARRCVELLGNAARAAGTGIEWSDCTDVISGGAGIGLFLIYMAETDRDPLARELAIRAGRRLLDLGERESVGRSWRMDPTFSRVMPNFSHGTAGVAFFLARLYELTGDTEFLDAALDGGRHVLSLADTSDGGCRVFHHSNETDAKDDAEGRALHYLGWCHGPVGTAQLFMKLAQVSGDADWTDRALQCAKSVSDSGVPEKATPGFWNNVGLCCGSAGVANFFETLALARSLASGPSVGVAADDPDHLFARRCLDQALEHATRDGDGLRFPQAEHRVKPDLVQAQVGLMQGAAGVGLALLRIAGHPSGVPGDLPDDPISHPSGRFPSSLFPAVPAAAPNAATTAFENCARGVLFQADALRRDDPERKTLRNATPTTLACDSWFDAAQAAGAKLVVLQVLDRTGFALWDRAETTDDVAGIHEGADLVAPFVKSARARGLAVGLSLTLAAPPSDARSPYPWRDGVERDVRDLLAKYGPLMLLRIDVPAELREWPHVIGDRLHAIARACDPHVLVEFMTFDRADRDVRGPDGVQRIGIPGDGHYDARFESGVAPRADELWPTDVVAGFQVGPIQVQGVAGASLLREPPPGRFGPWRTVFDRRCYVPLQVELEVAVSDGEPRRPPPSQPPKPKDPLATFPGGLGNEVRFAASRCRNLLFVVHFDTDGKLDPRTVTALRELGKR